MIAGIIYGLAGHAAAAGLTREMVDALRSARVQDLVLVSSDEVSWFDGPVISGEGTASLLAALRALPQEELHGVLCCPVDGPTLSQPLIVELLQGFWRTGKRIILPAEGVRPALIGTPLVAVLARARSLEEFIASHPGEIFRIAAVPTVPAKGVPYDQG